MRDGLLSLIAVVRLTINEVKPVLDYWESNKHVSCHMGGEFIDVCGETLQRWRQKSAASTIVDLKSAYLQIHVKPHLWKYQFVHY